MTTNSDQYLPSLKELTGKELYNSWIIVDNFNKYKELTQDERLWSFLELFDYKAILKHCINKLQTENEKVTYNNINDLINQYNDELLQLKYPIISMNTLFKYYKKHTN